MIATSARIAAVLLVCGACAAARAQAPDAGEARDEFVAGLEAAEALHWDRALAHFERSYALAETSAALYNIATTLRALGRHLEAHEALTRLLRSPGLEDDVRAAASEMLDEETARLATLVLSGLPRGDVSVRIDGALRRDDGERPLTLRTDAGERTLAVEEPGHEPFYFSATLGEGERREVDVTLRPIAAAEPDAWYESPWPWVIGGAVVAGAVVVAVLLASAGQLAPRTDTVLRP